MTIFWCHVILFSVISLQLIASILSQDDVTVHRVNICFGKKFRQPCSSYEVLDIKLALFGRAKLGDCLDQFSYYNCSVDVTGLVKARCISRESCKISPEDAELWAVSQCPDGLSETLYVEFTCTEDTKLIMSDDLSYLETFQAQCERDEVVEVVQAECGRVSVCRDIRIDDHIYAQDVTEKIKQLCSNRQNCETNILDPEFQNVRNCPQDRCGYYAVEYKCVKGTPLKSEEVCSVRTFDPVCARDEVIVIEKALYGRMKRGFCLQASWRQIGCQVDVTSLVESHCSGRRSCSVNITDSEFTSLKPCPKYLDVYLLVEYQCKKVITPDSGACAVGSGPYHIPASSGIIASLTSQETNCGSKSNPWFIDVKPGQKVVVYKYDFDEGSKNLTNPRFCLVYGVIKEIRSGRHMTICGGPPSHAGVQDYPLAEISSPFEIIIKPRNVNEHRSFILKYQVVGCPTIEPISGVTIILKYFLDIVTITCVATGKTYALKCVQSKWIGTVPNCATPQFSDSLDGADIESEDYCMGETFKAECGQDKRIKILKALNGRMGIGRCVRMNYGAMGCQDDVTLLVAARCSGRKSCEISLPDPELDALKACPEDLKTYLHVEYQCVKS